MSRYLVLYLTTLAVLTALDFLFLGIVAKGFFVSEVGDMLGEIRTVPAVLFYLLYVVGVLIFVSGPASATWPSTLAYGALFGLFCYATFDLTSLALLKHWTWAGRSPRRVLGRGGDCDRVDRRVDGGESAGGKILIPCHSGAVLKTEPGISRFPMRSCASEVWCPQRRARHARPSLRLRHDPDIGLW